jgi:hypothetical protein
MLGAGIRQRELSAPFAESRRRTKMPRRAASAAWGFAATEEVAIVDVSGTPRRTSGTFL